MKEVSENHSVISDSLQPHVLYSPQNSPGQNTGADSHSLLQGIFPTQGSNPGLPHCRQILYQLSHQGSPQLFLVVSGLIHFISSLTWNMGWATWKLEKEMATLSSILAWEIPWTEVPGGLQSMGLQESDTTLWLNHHHHHHRHQRESPRKRLWYVRWSKGTDEVGERKD